MNNDCSHSSLHQTLCLPCPMTSLKWCKEPLPSPAFRQPPPDVASAARMQGICCCRTSFKNPTQNNCHKAFRWPIDMATNYSYCSTCCPLPMKDILRCQSKSINSSRGEITWGSRTHPKCADWRRETEFINNKVNWVPCIWCLSRAPACLQISCVSTRLYWQLSSSIYDILWNPNQYYVHAKHFGPQQRLRFPFGVPRNFRKCGHNRALQGWQPRFLPGTNKYGWAKSSQKGAQEV